MRAKGMERNGTERGLGEWEMMGGENGRAKKVVVMRGRK
jgi:hypothetical protein